MRGIHVNAHVLHSVHTSLYVFWAIQGESLILCLCLASSKPELTEKVGQYVLLYLR
jgi:hypothetical protein